MYIIHNEAKLSYVISLLYTVQKIHCCMYNVYNQDPTLSTSLTLDHEQNLTNSTLYKYKQSLVPKV